MRNIDDHDVTFQNRGKKCIAFYGLLKMGVLFPTFFLLLFKTRRRSKYICEVASFSGSEERWKVSFH